MESEVPKSTLFFDGSCPLCRAEIGLYRRQDQADALSFVDASATGAVTPQGMTQQQAMERFHVRAGDGRVLSGAAAFVEVWSRLPGGRWAARAAALPGALAVLELGYRMFLPVRPISRLFGNQASLVHSGPRRQPSRSLQQRHIRRRTAVRLTKLSVPRPDRRGYAPR